MLVLWAATRFFHFLSRIAQQFLPYGNSEGPHHLIVLSSGELLCSDGQGLVVHDCQPSAQP